MVGAAPVDVAAVDVAAVAVVVAAAVVDEVPVAVTKIRRHVVVGLAPTQWMVLVRIRLLFLMRRLTLRSLWSLDRLLRRALVAAVLVLLLGLTRIRLWSLLLYQIMPLVAMRLSLIRRLLALVLVVLV
jgi:hypothetical protein